MPLCGAGVISLWDDELCTTTSTTEIELSVDPSIKDSDGVIDPNFLVDLSTPFEKIVYVKGENQVQSTEAIVPVLVIVCGMETIRGVVDPITTNSFFVHDTATLAAPTFSYDLTEVFSVIDSDMTTGDDCPITHYKICSDALC